MSTSQVPPSPPRPIDKESARTGQVRSDTAGVALTAAAVEKVKALLQQEGRDGLRLRVAVQPGGCSGLRYQLFFDDRLVDGDMVTRYGDSSPPGTGHPERDEGHDSGYESGPDE